MKLAVPPAFRSIERLLLPLISIVLGALPCAGEDDESSPFLEKLAALEETYEKEYLERSAKAFDEYMAGLTALEEILRSSGRQSAAKRVADERLKQQKERKALQGNPDAKETASEATDIPSDTIVVDLSRAETKGGVVFDEKTESLVGWQAREAEAVLEASEVPAGKYEIWAEYARLSAGRLLMQVQHREFRPALPVTDSLDTYQFAKMTDLSLTEPGEVSIVISMRGAQPRESYRLRKLELRRKPALNGPPD